MTQRFDVPTNGVAADQAEVVPAVSMVVPLFNEVDSVPQLVRELTRAADRISAPCELIFVDDGSQDGTWPALTACCSADPRICLIRFKRNFGQTAAMACGIARARGQVIVTLDGDLQNDPADIPRLLARIDEGCDIVCGWRHRRQDKLWTRRVPSIVANRLIGWITGVHLHDYGCSLKASRADMIKRTPLYAEFHRFIPALGTLTGARVTELRVAHRPRRYGKTKYTLSRTWRVALDMLRVALLIRFSNKPLRLFGAMALGSAWMGIALFAVSWKWYVGPYIHVSQVLPGSIVLLLWLTGHLLIVGWLAELCLATAHVRPERLIVGEMS